MANSLVLDTLKPYVDQERNREMIISEAVLSPKTLKYLTVQDGIKGKTSLQTMTANVGFGSGDSCGFVNTSTVKISQRFLDPVMLRVGLEICSKEVLNTYAQYKIKVTASEDAIPFEEYIFSLIAKKIARKYEDMLWTGEKSEAGDAFDGLLTIIKNDVHTINLKAEATEMATVRKLYDSLPEEVLVEDDLVIFASPSNFRKYVAELVDANMYHYNATDTSGEVTIPGTDVKVVSVPGLSGTDSYVAGRTSNLFAGLDMESAIEDFKVVYDERTETFLITILFNGATQVAFPNEVAYTEKVTE